MALPIISYALAPSWRFPKWLNSASGFSRPPATSRAPLGRAPANQAQRDNAAKGDHPKTRPPSRLRVDAATAGPFSPVPWAFSTAPPRGVEENFWPARVAIVRAPHMKSAADGRVLPTARETHKTPQDPAHGLRRILRLRYGLADYCCMGG